MPRESAHEESYGDIVLVMGKRIRPNHAKGDDGAADEARALHDAPEATLIPHDLEVEPGTCWSPRHGMPLDSRNKGSHGC